MTKYNVLITKTQRLVINVEADNEEHAKVLAVTLAKNGHYESKITSIGVIDCNGVKE